MRRPPIRSMRDERRKPLNPFARLCRDVVKGKATLAAACCACLLAVAGASPTAAQETGTAARETSVAGAALDSGGGPLLSFGDDPNRRLVINGFGVLGYDYSANTGKNSFADSALALSVYKGINDNLTVFAQLTTSRGAPSPFLADVGTTNDVATDIDNLQLRWQPSLISGFDVTVGKFDSPMAIERDDAPLNFQATSSFTFDFARPVKFTGFAAAPALSPPFR